MGLFRLLGKFIYFILISLAVVLIGAVGFSIWAVYQPRPAWALVQKYLLPEDLKIDFKNFEVSARAVDWLNYNFTFNIEDLIIAKGEPQLLLPFPKVKGDVHLGLFSEEAWLVARTLEIDGREGMTYKPTSDLSDEGAQQNLFEIAQQYLAYLNAASRYSTLESLQVKIPEITLPMAGGNAVIRLDMRKPAAQNAPDEVLTSFTYKKSETESSGVIRLNGRLIERAQNFLNADVKLAVGESTVETSVLMKGGHNLIEIGGKAKVASKSGGSTLRPQFTWALSLAPREGVLTIQGEIGGLPSPLLALRDLDFVMSVPMDPGHAWSQVPASFKLAVPLPLFIVDEKIRPHLERTCQCKIPKVVKVEGQGRVWLHTLFEDKPTKDKQRIIDARMAIDRLTNKLFSLSLAAQASVFRRNDEWLVEPQLDSEATIHSFQGMRQFLDARGVIIPAPFDILDGKISLNARSPITHGKERAKSSIVVSTDLFSATQKVQTEIDILLDLDKQLRGLDAHVRGLIKMFAVELPPLDPILGIPRVAKDSRVLLTKEAPASKPGFRTRVFIDVKTVDAGSIRLLSKLAYPYVPLALSVNTQAAGESSGFIRAEPFTIKYLRREVDVERFQLTLAENANGDFPISGRFRIDQTAYKIHIDIGGTMDNPQINMSSDPSLPRSEIISVLLYDRTSDQLVSADAETVGQFEAALADRAIGIIGLWAFASTPIRSFSYNPVTKVYSATVQLADGLTAGVGTNWERAAHLEVRKRVSRRWVLTASWSPTQDREQVGKLVLQWEKRF